MYYVQEAYHHEIYVLVSCARIQTHNPKHQTAKQTRLYKGDGHIGYHRCEGVRNHAEVLIFPLEIEDFSVLKR